MKGMSKRCLLLPFLLLCLCLQVRAQHEFFARMVPDREHIYAGDSMLLSVVLYATAPIDRVESKTEFSVKGKCRFRPLRINRNATAGRTREGNKVYYTMVWAQYVVAPSEVGTYTVPAQKFKATLQEVTHMPDLFEQMMGARPEYREIPISGTSGAFDIVVKEKPLRTTQEMLRSGVGVM